MNVLIALLRGINVGGRNKLPMKELVSVLESLGCSGVRTYLQSGNAVFLGDRGAGTDFATAIGGAVAARHGFEPNVLVLDREDLERAVLGNPYDTSVGKALHFFFLVEAPPEPDLAAMEGARSPTEEFTLTDDVFYLHAPDGIGCSKLAGAVERHLGVACTGRNWNTVEKLAEMAAEMESR